jgi:hypothetical protein
MASPGLVATGLGSYLIPAFYQIQQEQRCKLSFFRQECQMLAMNFNRSRSHSLERIASEPDQKSLIRHETVMMMPPGSLLTSRVTGPDTGKVRSTPALTQRRKRATFSIAMPGVLLHMDIFCNLKNML